MLGLFLLSACMHSWGFQVASLWPLKLALWGKSKKNSPGSGAGSRGALLSSAGRVGGSPPASTHGGKHWLA